MTCSCLSNSTMPSGDTVGMASRFAATLDFTSTSSSAACQLRRPHLYISLQLKLLFLGTKRRLLLVDNLLDDTLMSLLQCVKVSTHHDRKGLCKPKLLDTRTISHLAYSDGGIRIWPSWKRSNPLTMLMYLPMSSCIVRMDDLASRLITLLEKRSLTTYKLVVQSVIIYR